MEPATSLRFAGAARLLGAEARRLGLLVPGFRSPPRLAGLDRSLRRRPGGGATVSVRIRGRPHVAVAADMIEGIIACNRLGGREADTVRSALWRALGDAGHEAA